MALIALVRHGAVEAPSGVLWGRSLGLHLSETGIAQAYALAKRFQTERVETIWTSPLERARETAAILAGCLNRPLEVDERLNEIDYGSWSGRSLAELAADPAWKAFHRAQCRGRIPGGESMSQAQHRITSFLGDLGLLDERRFYVVITHAEPIRLTLAALLDTKEYLQTRIEISPASVTAFDLQNLPVVLTVNDISHLGGWRGGAPRQL